MWHLQEGRSESEVLPVCWMEDGAQLAHSWLTTLSMQIIHTPVFWFQVPQAASDHRLALQSLEDRKILIDCGKLNNGPQNVHILTTGTCGFITSHGKKDFADVINKDPETGKLFWIN